jgi:glycerol uptake facilitator-like aquaporin
MIAPTFSRRLIAEALGTALLLATVVGSGIMGERLAGGNIAIALLANAIATGAVLYALITTLGPISGAHFNPLVTLVDRAAGRMTTAETLSYIGVQIVSAVAGVLAAHGMFELPLLMTSQHIRTGPAQWWSEVIATFGLMTVILFGVRHRSTSVATAVAMYITAAYWFTASTSFANPAVTIARMLTDTFAGIRPVDAPAFILAQCFGGFIAYGLFRWMNKT